LVGNNNLSRFAAFQWEYLKYPCESTQVACYFGILLTIILEEAKLAIPAEHDHDSVKLK